MPRLNPWIDFFVLMPSQHQNFKLCLPKGLIASFWLLNTKTWRKYRNGGGIFQFFPKQLCVHLFWPKLHFVLRIRTKSLQSSSNKIVVLTLGPHNDVENNNGNCTTYCAYKEAFYQFFGLSGPQNGIFLWTLNNDHCNFF